MEFALAGLFVAFTGAGIAGVLLGALILGTVVAGVFGGIFFAMNRLGRAVAQRSAGRSRT